MEAELKRFRIEVAESVLTDLHNRLEVTRYPEQIAGSGWDYGTELTYLMELCDYWKTSYDWRKHEAKLNEFDQYTTQIDGQELHFLHVRSRDQLATPLLILHGWPGSVVEFSKVIGPLADPVGYGADGQQPFHVVCPSLPGYAFSGPTTEPGWDTRRMAFAFAELMRKLGYEEFGVQGGDWGALIATQMGLEIPQPLLGIHLNMVIAGPPEGDDLSDLTEKELTALGDMANYEKVESGYAKIQGTKPQTLGYGLNDSPAGLAAWIVEKFRAWSDCEGQVERSFSRDELLTNIMVYWVTQTANSSARLYFETQKSGRFGLAGGRIEVPTGCAIFPKELVRAPRKWAEHQYKVVHWSEMERGGHFAAFEQPAMFVSDVRSFFSKLG